MPRIQHPLLQIDRVGGAHLSDDCSPPVPPSTPSPLPILHHMGLTTPRPIPRKEVIQPQFPLRLPCYDFVPITHPTLDGCPPEGLAHRLQVLPAFVT